MAIIKRVFSTRPAHQQLPWQAALADVGVQLEAVPLMEIVPVETPQQQETIKQQILRLDEFSCCIFVSQNAVQHAFTWIDQYWPQFPLACRMLCIGSKTQAVAEQQFSQAYSAGLDIVGLSEKTDMTTESLLASGYLGDVDGKKILIFRGVGGRNTLAESLTEQGASVEYCELYDRVLPPSAAGALAKAKVNSEEDLITLFSGETLQNLHSLIEGRVDQWSRVRLLVPSQRVADIAQKLGYTRVITAANASETQMWNTLQQTLSSL